MQRSAVGAVLQRHRVPLVSWAAVALVVNWTQQVTYRIVHSGFTGVEDLLPGRFLPHAGRIAWDAGLYQRVAEDGYRLPDGLEAGFPGYALAIRALHGPLGGYEQAAVLISMASGLAAALLFWRWMELRGSPERARRVALWLFLLYPYAFMIYGVAYSDALLVALVMGVLVAIESERYVLAGIVAAAATATRPTALVLLPALVVLTLERTGALSVRSSDPTVPPGSTRRRSGAGSLDLALRPGRLRPRHLGVLLCVVGIGSYMFFLQRHAGDPLYFWTVQTEGYGHTGFLSPRTWLKVRFFASPLLEVHHLGDVSNEVAATVLVAGTILATPSVSRRFGWGYGVLLAGFAATAWVTGTWFSPGGRYLLPVIPVLAAWAAPWLLDRPRLLGGVLGAFAVASIALTIGFAGVFDIHW